MDVVYKLDGVDLRNYGVYVSASDGILSKPKPKTPLSLEWKDSHGEVIDQSKRYYESREIKLDCFIKAPSQQEFITLFNSFVSLFDTANTKRLMVSIENLSMGTNLVRSSNFESTAMWASGLPTILSENATKYISIGYAFTAHQSIVLAASTTYTLSLKVRNKNSTIRSFRFVAGTSPSAADFTVSIPANSGWVDVVKTFTTNSNTTDNACYFLMNNNNDNTKIDITNLKLETGSSATGWTPAPLDLKPLLFEVFLSDTVSLKKEWQEKTMIGTFSLKLKEPEPIKKVIFLNEEDETLTITTTKPVNIYWGDGTHTFDVMGTAQVISHSYDHVDYYYIVITGDIDAITSLTTLYGTVLWPKL
jgi:hypothetical protein